MNIGMTSVAIAMPQAPLSAASSDRLTTPPPQAPDALTTFSAAVATGLPLSAILAAQAGMEPLIEPSTPRRAMRVQPVQKSERS